MIRLCGIIIPNQRRKSLCFLGVKTVEYCCFSMYYSRILRERVKLWYNGGVKRLLWGDYYEWLKLLLLQYVSRKLIMVPTGDLYLE